MHQKPWIRLRFDESKWWIATILTAVAVARTPMSLFFTFVAWAVAISWLAISVCWDFCRWHWPFFPKEIEDQIRKGIELSKSESLKDGNSQGEWQGDTEACIRACWGFRSPQEIAFKDASGVPSDIIDRTLHPELLLRNQLLCLKRLDPA